MAFHRVHSSAPLGAVDTVVATGASVIGLTTACCGVIIP